MAGTTAGALCAGRRSCLDHRDTASTRLSKRMFEVTKHHAAIEG
jgi:hypothetical protein